MGIPSTGLVGRRQAVGKRIVAADAIHLDRLIRDGPPDGDLAGALESMRLKILDQGVKSDTDGMVDVQLSNPITLC
jgi:cell cycle arrest protein BUB2